MSDQRPGQEPIQFSHSGHRYLLGYGVDSYGIWDRETPGTPVQRFPRTDEGWAQAWQAFVVLEPNHVGVALGPSGEGGARSHRAEHDVEAVLLGRLANPWRRLVARFLDGVMLVGVALLISFVLSPRPAELSTNSQVVTFVVTLQIISFLYEVILIAIRGQTLGKSLMGIRVVGITDGQVPGWARAGVRWLLPAAASLVPPSVLIVYLWLLWDPRRQGLHDKAAGTLVIQA